MHSTGRKGDQLQAKEQIQITEITPLLNEKGMIQTPGYAKKMVYLYNKDHIQAHHLRIKEWDFYQLNLGDYILKMTIGNIAYVGEFSAELFNVVTKEIHTFSRMKLFPMNRIQLPLSPEEPSVTTVSGKDFEMAFEVTEEGRHLFLKAKDPSIGNVSIDVWLNDLKQDEKMVIATPFHKDKCFYLNCKAHYFGGHGHIHFGERHLEVDHQTTGVLDWGRGVWPFSQEWFWGNGAGYVNGHHFGFNIGWGFGNLENADENMIFWDGKAIKLSSIHAQVNLNDYMSPWSFSDENDQFVMEMTPVYDKVADTHIGPIQMYCHQLFGYYNGYIRLDDGEKIEIHNFLAFCEHAKNRW